MKNIVFQILIIILYSSAGLSVMRPTNEFSDINHLVQTTPFNSPERIRYYLNHLEIPVLPYINESIDPRFSNLSDKNAIFLRQKLIVEFFLEKLPDQKAKELMRQYEAPGDLTSLHYKIFPYELIENSIHINRFSVFSEVIHLSTLRSWELYQGTITSVDHGFLKIISQAITDAITSYYFKDFPFSFIAREVLNAPIQNNKLELSLLSSHVKSATKSSQEVFINQQLTEEHYSGFSKSQEVFDFILELYTFKRATSHINPTDIKKKNGTPSQAIRLNSVSLCSLVFKRF